MPSLSEVISEHTELTPADVADLQALLDEWQLLADLSFSDLILWVPDADPNVFWAAAQVRPTTGPTALDDDVVGEEIAYEPDSLVSEAFLSEEIAMTSGNKLHAGIPVDQHAIPISRRGRVIGVVEMHTNQMGVRAPGALEETYLDCSRIVRGMLRRGEFPSPGEKTVPWISPHLVDGSLHLDAGGTVTFASPNAVSAFRRLGLVGDPTGERLADVLRRLPSGLDPVDLAPTHAGLAHEFDVETASASVRMRLQPLSDDDGPCGCLLMCRDSTELRTTERQLVTKDATIREIHHRVKNNLQTVSALLRLQARRTESEEATNALTDAQKRVTAIAVVHEILSQAFENAVQFDDVADRLLNMVRDVAAVQHRVGVRRQGSFGSVQADTATSLALVLTELIQNAIEHGLGTDGDGGTVEVLPRRDDGVLVVEVRNSGRPLPDEFTLEGSKSLGLSIVSTLVQDLHGRIAVEPLPGGAGTVARLELPLA